VQRVLRLRLLSVTTQCLQAPSCCLSRGLLEALQQALQSPFEGLALALSCWVLVGACCSM